jgi:cytochrome P450
MSATATVRRRAQGSVDLARSLRRLRRDPLAELTLLVRYGGDPARFRIGARDALLVRRHDQIERVLLGDQDSYRKSEHYALVGRVLGDGLLTSEGELWRSQRRIVQPLFAKRGLERFAPEMVAATTDTVARLEATAPGAAPDMLSAFSELTLDVVGRTLFGVHLGRDAGRVGEALTRALHLLIDTMVSPLAVLAPQLVGRTDVVPFTRLRRLERAVAELDSIVGRMIAERAGEASAEGADLLGLLLRARDPETGVGMAPSQVRDELMTFVLAGHETTATALSWTHLLLSRHPEAREALLAEVDEVLGGAPPRAGDVERLPWTTAVIREAMRLYPPVWGLAREAAVDTELGGRRVAAGTVVAVLPYLAHRDPAVWDNPEGFDPRRFLPDAPPRPRFAYLPFGGGRRVCVGMGFAEQEAVLATATIAQRLTLDLAPGTVPVPQPVLTLRPRGGLRMTVARR